MFHISDMPRLQTHSPLENNGNVPSTHLILCGNLAETEENTFIPLNPSLKVKPLDVVIGDSGLTLREVCLKRFKGQHEKRRKILGQRSPVIGSICRDLETALVSLNATTTTLIKQNTPRQSSQLVKGGIKESMKINTVSALPGEIASSGAFSLRTHRNSIHDAGKNKLVKNRNARIHNLSQIQDSNTQSNYLHDDIDSIEKRALQIKQIDKAPFYEQFYNAALAKRSPRNYLANESSLNISHATDFIQGQPQQDTSQASTIEYDQTMQKLIPFTHRSKKAQQRERHLSNYSEVIRGNTLQQKASEINEVTRDKTLKSQIMANQSELYCPDQQLSAMNTEQQQQIPKVLLLPSINIKRLLQKYDEVKKPQKKRNQSVVPPLMHKTIFDQQQQAMQNEHIKESNATSCPEKQATFYNQHQWSVNQLKDQIMGVVHSGSIPILDQQSNDQSKQKSKKETWRVIPANKTKFDNSPRNSNTIFQHVSSGQQTIGGILGTLPTKDSIMAIITPKHNRIQVPQISTDPLGSSKRHISMAPVYPQYKLQPKHLQPLNTVIEHLQQKLQHQNGNACEDDEIESLRNSTTFSTRNPLQLQDDHHLRSFEDQKAPILQQYLPASLSINDSLVISSGQTQVKEEVSPFTVKKYGKARTDLQLCLHNSQGPVINGGPIVMFAREEKSMKKKQCSSNSIKDAKQLLTPKNDQDQNKVTPSKPDDTNPMYCNQLDKIDESVYDSDSSCGYSGTLSSLMEGENNDDYQERNVSRRKSTKRISHVQKSILAPVSMKYGGSPPLQIDVDSLERTPKNHLDTTIATPSSAISPEPPSSPTKFRERLLSKRFKVELLPTNNSIEVHSGKRLSLDKDDVFRQREHIRKIIQEDSYNSHKL